MDLETAVKLDRMAQYKICKERGHTPGDKILASNPPYTVCKFCGTGYRIETTLVETNVPMEVI